MKWKVQKRKNCKTCGSRITKPRFRTFCSKKCRTRDINIRHGESQKEWQRKQRGKYASNKLRCIICGKWYVQVGSHVHAVHNMTAREYRQAHDLPLLRGVVPSWYRKMKGRIAQENGTVENLQKGKRKRYKKGDKRARLVTGWKGRAGSLGYTPDEYYQ